MVKTKSLLLKNCRILDNDVLVQTDILISNGKIKKLAANQFKADKFIDLKNKIVMPGVIDSHVHFRDPGLTNKEDFLTGSKAASKGGITTIIDMPNTVPPTVSVKNLNLKRKNAKKSVVNYGFHFGVTDNNLSEITKAKNIASVKIFMDSTTGNMKVDDVKVLAKIFKKCKIVSVHAEGNKIKKAVNLINKTKNMLYLCHISSNSELAAIKKNDRIFIEVTPHHLFLTIKDCKKLGPFAKMKPNLKTKKDAEALWNAINSGFIDTVATDHAPHTKDEKIKYAPYGVPGVETMLPLLIDSVNKKKLALERLVKLCCENPAKIFKIKGKGYIKEGFDADLTVIDMDMVKQVKNDELLTKCGWSPFNGKILKGWPVMTIVNGNIIYDNGKINKIPAKEVRYYE
ncbi:MAG: dihydroorotase family protein [Nanoarchaeota archaeon]